MQKKLLGNYTVFKVCNFLTISHHYSSQLKLLLLLWQLTWPVHLIFWDQGKCVVDLFSELSFHPIKKQINQEQTYFSQTFQMLSHCISTAEKLIFQLSVGAGQTRESYGLCPRLMLWSTGSSQHPQGQYWGCHLAV